MRERSRPNCPIFLNGNRLTTSPGAVPVKTGAFLTSFVACWPKVKKQIASFSSTWHKKWHAQEAGARRATKTGLPGWMRIAVRIGKKGLRPHQSGAARGDKMDLRCPK